MFVDVEPAGTGSVNRSTGCELHHRRSLADSQVVRGRRAQSGGSRHQCLQRQLHPLGPSCLRHLPVVHTRCSQTQTGSSSAHAVS